MPCASSRNPTAADGRFTLLWDGGNGRSVQDESGTWREEGAEHAQVIALKEGYHIPGRLARAYEVLAFDPETAELALEGTILALQHPGFFLREVALEEQRDLEHLELVQPLLCEFQVELAGGPESADSFQVLDAEERVLRLLESFGRGLAFDELGQLSQGLSPVLRVDETATTLVLQKAGVEVLRRPLVLDPLARTTVRP